MELTAMTADTIEGGPGESLYRHVSQFEVNAEDVAAETSTVSQGRADFAMLRRRVLTATLVTAGVLAVAASAWRMGAGVQRQKIAPGAMIEMPLLNTDTYEFSVGTIEYRGTEECLYVNKHLGHIIQLTECDITGDFNHDFLLPKPGQSGPIKMKENPDWCLDAPDAPSGHQLQFWHCSQCPVNHCVWKMPNNAHGEIHLHSEPHQCVDVPSEDVVFTKKTLELWPCRDPKEYGNLKFKVHYKDHSIRHCRLSRWSDWRCAFTAGSKCVHVRAREVLQQPSGGGLKCHGNLLEQGSPCPKKKCIQNGGPNQGKGRPYDCAAGYANWKAGWTKGKKAWCCIHRMRGCTTSTLDGVGRDSAFGQSVGVLAPLLALLCAWPR